MPQRILPTPENDAPIVTVTGSDRWLTLEDSPVVIDVTTWTAHATREPSDDFLSAMDRRWRDGLAAAAVPCEWSRRVLPGLVVVHVDRATHKRRLRTAHFTGGRCEATDHGFSPMSDLIPGDPYGPEPLCVRHTGEQSPLAAAIAAAKEEPHLLAIAVITEQQFTDIDSFDDHSGVHLRPESHGAVLPFVYAAAEESPDDAFEREDLLRANGFSTYTVDVTSMGTDPIATQGNIAALMEDVCDEIAQLKADAAAGILTQNPLWPLIVVRAPAEWSPAPASSARSSGREGGALR